MRKRERDYRSLDSTSSEFVQGPRSSLWPSGSKPLETPNNLLAGDWDIIEDVVGDFEGENPCYHYTSTSKLLKSGIAVSVDHNVAPLGNVFAGTLRGPGGNYSIDYAWEVALTLPVNHPSTTTLDYRWFIPNYSYEGWMNVYPVIREQLKLINSIYELKDFAKLRPLARETRKGFRSLDELSKQYVWKSEAKRRGELRLMYDLLQPQSPATWSYLLKLPRKVATRLPLYGILERLVSLGKLSASHFLNWKFATEPLMRDIGAFSSASRSVARQLPGLLARADGETVHKSHWSKILETSQINGFKFLDRDSNTWQGPIEHVYTKPWCEMVDGPKYTFTARYSYKFSPEALRFAERLAMMDALGINPSAANIWQAIPWSFTIDWFSRVGDFLESFTPHNLEPIVYFYGASHSLKYKVETGMDIKSDIFSNSPDYTCLGLGAQTTIATRTEEYYIRKNVVPFVSLPKTSDFSTLEKLLALALGLSSIRYTTQ